MSTVTGQATGGMRWISINLQTRALRQAVSVVLFLLVTTLAQTVAKTNCTQPVETVMQTIRQRGRDATAIHDILRHAFISYSQHAFINYSYHAVVNYCS